MCICCRVAELVGGSQLACDDDRLKREIATCVLINAPVSVGAASETDVV